MTDLPQDSQRYSYIPIPKSKFPEPKYHFGQRVALYWQNDQGEQLCDIGEIIGMQYATRGNQPAQWSYRMRLVKCNYDSNLIGAEDEYFEVESRFVPGDSAIAD
jgi:hypothetical protein